MEPIESILFSLILLILAVVLLRVFGGINNNCPFHSPPSSPVGMILKPRKGYIELGERIGKNISSTKKNPFRSEILNKK